MATGILVDLVGPGGAATGENAAATMLNLVMYSVDRVFTEGRKDGSTIVEEGTHPSAMMDVNEGSRLQPPAIDKPCCWIVYLM